MDLTPALQHAEEGAVLISVGSAFVWTVAMGCALQLDRFRSGCCSHYMDRKEPDNSCPMTLPKVLNPVVMTRRALACWCKHGKCSETTHIPRWLPPAGSETWKRKGDGFVSPDGTSWVKGIENPEWHGMYYVSKGRSRPRAAASEPAEASSSTVVTEVSLN